MKMIRMERGLFLSYILDQRKNDCPKALQAYYLNPNDAHGKPSSFVIVVVVDPSNPGMYAGVSKFNPLDGADPSSPHYTKFSLEEGLKQACNRAWREMFDMPSLYGKGSNPKPRNLRMQIGAIMVSRFASLFGSRSKRLESEAGRQRLLAALSEVGNAPKTPAHS